MNISENWFGEGDLTICSDGAGIGYWKLFQVQGPQVSLASLPTCWREHGKSLTESRTNVVVLKWWVTPRPFPLGWPKASTDPFGRWGITAGERQTDMPAERARV